MALKGVKTEGPMAKDISIANQRPADYVFSGHVEKKLAEIKAKAGAKGRSKTLTAAE